MIKRLLLLAVIVLSIALFMGCASGPFAKHECGEHCSHHHDSFDEQTESMRGEIDHVKSSSSSSAKKSSGNSGMIYGGLSSEAKEIEDSLYGN